jgi:BirA family biotin operon repressor/biotin-[acetyl-CoA-carboxylase] ligase
MSESLKLSRAAVWKHIKKLQSLGYKIDSRPKIGYRLTGTTELLLPWEIRDGLETKLFGKRIYYFDTINSTQNFAAEIASKPQENGTLVIAQRQTQGRGRLSRKWTSPNGGIWMSLILHPEFEVSVSTFFPIISSLALVVSIEKVLKIKPKIKWPNDLTINNKKVAGILIDASIESGNIGYLILGVGINFKINVKEIEKNIKNTGNFYGVATLVNKKNKANPVKLVQRFLLDLERLYTLFSEGNSEYIANQWTSRSSTIGKTIIVTSQHGPIEGKAIKIDKEGALVISSKGRNQRVLVGDVS